MEKALLKLVINGVGKWILLLLLLLLLLFICNLHGKNYNTVSNRRMPWLPVITCVLYVEFYTFPRVCMTNQKEKA